MSHFTKNGALTLFRNVTTLSQDEFLFHGTIAENLDPEGKFSTDEINAAVDRVGLRSRVDRIGGLGGIIEEQGRNLSQGEKQLMCFARWVHLSSFLRQQF